jgi:hypothetical protein
MEETDGVGEAEILPRYPTTSQHMNNHITPLV